MRRRVAGAMLALGAVVAVVAGGCDPARCGGGTCSCTGADDCSKFCAGTGCAFDCSGAGECFFDCPHGGCTATGGSLSCEVGGCSCTDCEITYCPTSAVSEESSAEDDGSLEIVCPSSDAPWSCAAGDACACLGPGDCAIACEGAGCSFDCGADAGSCTFDCPAGDCTASTESTHGTCSVTLGAETGPPSVTACTGSEGG